MSQQPISLEKPIGEEESELGDFVEDQAAESPFEIASENLRKEKSPRAGGAAARARGHRDALGRPAGARARWRRSTAPST
jgi:hypothetical protein